MRQLPLGPNSVAKAISVTTRGVGFTSAFSYCFFKDVEPRLAATNCIVNTVYRVNLALFQTQLSLSSVSMGLALAGHLLMPFRSAHHLRSVVLSYR